MKKSIATLMALVVLLTTIPVQADTRINLYPEQTKYLKGGDVHYKKTEIYSLGQGYLNKVAIIGKEPGKSEIVIADRRYTVIVKQVPNVTLTKLLTYNDIDLYEVVNKSKKDVTVNCIIDGVYQNENSLLKIKAKTTGYAIVTKDSEPVVGLARNDIKTAEYPTLSSYSGKATDVIVPNARAHYVSLVVGYDKSNSVVSVNVFDSDRDISSYSSKSAVSWKIYTIGNILIE